MPAYWIYKCNAKGHEYQRAYGDWNDIFSSQKPQYWGSTEFVPELANAKVGDTILAYQTDRNELVGIARAVAWKRRGKFMDLYLKPVRPIGVRVRLLKQLNLDIASIPALQPGPIHTLYPISREDTDALRKAADARLRESDLDSGSAADRRLKGVGFGTPEENKLVERAAIEHVVRRLKNQKWSVRNVSLENRGYDLDCRRNGKQQHVEVKGTRGEGQQFIITEKETFTWKTDKHFVLAFVQSALSSKPILSLFPGRAALKEFTLRPLAYVAKRRPDSLGGRL